MFRKPTCSQAHRAVVADSAAYDWAEPSKLATNEQLRERVAALLVEDWSPQQIAAVSQPSE